MSSKKVLPTKLNLITLRRQSKLIKTIRRILENKREVLLLYLRTYAAEYESVYGEVVKALKVSYDGILNASVDEGLDSIQQITSSTPRTLEVGLVTKSIFGVKIPIVKLNESSIPQRTFSGIETSPYLVESYDQMKDGLKMLIRLVELESTIRSLSMELRRTQRLINAVDNSIMPFYDSSIKYVKTVLEDRMREEFIRLKVMRRMLQRRR
ncbi:V-type ATP synthase subunit D [Sulfodiicoccus acidiphilus]|uniref:A-type ATP synthase subunit D n=1 Tax=Sulfodiicoccus acidiphilus TaxID=1670455 RepID=A0A348B0T2_9CREN|nr:V-type ATP synthase subunit D [Sulfodiicoccus acidiphilus]BBD71784.1 V-type ATP synthase subunit D [Sulfodiicoccus acidiphilus]GGT99174.1 V-type ATP synthase subunit D [Sulfodiicoccus acidiphilus]